MYSLSIIFSENYFDIIVKNSFISESREATIEYEKYMGNGFLVSLDAVYMALCDDNAKCTFLFDDKNVIVKKIKDEKIKLLKEPLDMSVSGNAEVAKDALISRDPGYMIEDKDIIDADIGLDGLANILGANILFDSISYEVENFI